MRRYAIYYAPPPGSALARFGDSWLGRDAATGAAVAQPTVAGIAPERLRAITASPRLYAFHGTLKAPFELAEGCGAEALHAAVRDLARERRPFRVPPLELVSLGGFLALVPSAPSAELDELAAACVRAFDRFRAPLSAQDLERRLAAGLSEREEAHLRRWGYPYVFEFFRFHLTLTERLAEPERSRVREALAPLVAPLCREPLAIEEVCVFEQPTRTTPFVVTGRYRLGAAGG